MDFFSLIEELSPEYGPAGFEDRVRDLLWQKLTPLCDETWTDTMGNLIGVKRSVQPDAKKLLLDAHMDEVGLIVTGIENGFLRFGNLGGIDARVLPATTVTVLTQDGPLPGVIDTMPPHALSTEDMDKAVPMDALVIDVGMTQAEAEATVPLGTPVAFCTRPERLAGERITGKSLDDRACAAMLLLVLEELKNTALPVDLYVMFSVQEELGTRGAGCGVYGIDPDWALVLDVTHAKTPDARSVTLMDLGGGPAIGVGPNMTRAISDTLIRLAKETVSPYQLEIMSGSSGTNAWPIQISRGGIAVGVLSLPLRYMHTPQEVIDGRDAEYMVRLVTEFVRRIEEVRAW